MKTFEEIIEEMFNLFDHYCTLGLTTEEEEMLVSTLRIDYYTQTTKGEQENGK